MTRSPHPAVQRRTRDLASLSAELSKDSTMKRIKELLPALVMAFTLFIGALGMTIIDVSIVRAATASDTAAATDTFSAAPAYAVTAPGFPS
jgi:hypothetical protein